MTTAVLSDLSIEAEAVVTNMFPDVVMSRLPLTAEALKPMWERRSFQACVLGGGPAFWNNSRRDTGGLLCDFKGTVAHIVTEGVGVQQRIAPSPRICVLRVSSP